VSRSQSFSALGLAFVAVLGLVYTLVAGNQPLLGLDLQGGVSVVLQPTGPADDEQLDQTLEIIRSRVDALGVAEPEISRQGNTIVVDLPGVEEQQRALELVGQTAELRFRPVIIDLGPSLELTPTLNPDALPDDDDGTTEDSEDTEEGLASPRDRRQENSDDDVEDNTDADAVVASEDEEPTEGEESEVPGAPAQTLSPEELQITAACGIPGVAAPEEDFADRYVVLTDLDGQRLCLGPSQLTGDALETADVALQGLNQWTVNPVFRTGATGIDGFNEVAQVCFGRTAACPSGRLAIVLDHEVISAPVIQAASFDRNNINISGSFEEEGARNLALVLRYGALPVELEAQQTRTVSATIGGDVLRSGLIAGAIGLVLVAIYLLSYYRLAALVAMAGIGISGLLIWTIISWLGENRGLAVTLAGVVGLIVSVGVSADSNIVYFENVKDIAISGRRVSTAVERAYQTAISTIVKADVVSLIGAVLLYFLTVGAVKGFAFYLGLATLLDLLVSYVFMRPALSWLAGLEAVQRNPRLIGLPIDDNRGPIAKAAASTKGGDT
jgi:preprotein translocase subunit SecD